MRVEIKFAEINGLYSYGSEKNRVDFGQKTVMVGANNSGKSAIFKALKYLIKCLTEAKDAGTRPWDMEGIHEITVGLSLNNTERRYVAEILAASGGSGQPSRLAPDHVIEWLAPRLERMDITIKLADNPHLPSREQIEYAADLKDLDVGVWSQGWDGRDVWVRKPGGAPSQSRVLFHDVIRGLLEKHPTSEGDAEKKMREDWPDECMISPFPEGLNLPNSRTLGKKRMELLLTVLKDKGLERARSFFTMLGILLEQKFVFVSEQRRFRKSNDFKMLPLKDDGSNLQGFLYWLHNGDGSGQNAYSEIQKMFSNVMERQNLSFMVSITERGEPAKHFGVPYPPKGKVYPGRAIVRFVEKRGQTERFTGFMDIGAGVRETLFLLAKCFGRQDEVILLDEPAANLHPTQIRRLMTHILSTNSRSGQVAVVTHSPALASLEMLSSVNEIVRVDRQECSRIIQPSGEDRRWISENLPTFQLLKSDILFAKKVILVEGNSDKIFLEAILNYGSRYGDDIVVVEVGGKRSFKKFRKFLEIFETQYGIFADNDGKKLFDSEEILEINLESIPQEGDWTGKKVCLLEQDLEHLLKGLEPKMYESVKKEYDKKPELTHEFVRRFFGGMNSGGIDDIPLLKIIMEWSIGLSH